MSILDSGDFVRRQFCTGGKATIPYDDSVEEALCFGWIDGLLQRIDERRYARKFTPRRSKSVWSELNKRRANRMIRQGRMTEAGLAKITEAKANGRWKKAASSEDLGKTPADLEKALAANKKAQRNFENLAPSYRKQFIAWITSAKRDETRQRRIHQTVTLAAENRKPGI